ncbi:transmembrane protein 59-like isoform X2 [Xenia sp. Carnegie-2017]|uniref:transmembrane protein 59-like isoform X2 n=1 Tax=Xenia sp. Carnegie-2017 TaxID=2897299 RepID=UPI001F03F483|nr:transmembrane protein 59-like isoform X2 [Xenia sp. Carnegie-2017]
MWRRFRFPVERNCSQECKVRFASGSYYACQTGCSWGKNIEIHQTVETNPTESHQQHSTVAGMILHPVMLLRTYGRGMINRLTYYIQSSTSYYFRSENGGLVVVNIQDQPRIIVSSKDPNARNNEIDVPGKQSDENTNGKYGEQYESWIIVRRGHHWLNCVSHKSGIPMWILSSILFLSSFFLLWLCCAATLSSSSSKKSCRKPKKAFLIREFLSEGKAKDDVPLLSLDENEAQAGSLPSK